MNKLILILILTILFCNYSLGQSKELNCIILIDNDVPDIGNISIRIKQDTTYSDWLKYLPGNILFSSKALTMFNEEAEKLYLLLEYSKTNKKKLKYYNYKIEFNRSWLSLPYILIRIYNRDEKYNKKKYDIPKDKEYIYRIDFSENSIAPIK